MYYQKMMKTVVESDLKSKSFRICKSSTHLREKEISLVNFRFYQKLFIVLMTISTILIIPESPRELQNICESYNPRKVCSVW